MQTRDLLEIIAKQKENNPNPVLTQENWNDITKIHNIDAVYKYEEFVQDIFYLQCLYAIVNDYFVQTKEYLPSKKFKLSEFMGIAVSLGVPESMVKNYVSENNIQLHDQLSEKRTNKKTVKNFVNETKLPDHIKSILIDKGKYVAYLQGRSDKVKVQIDQIEEKVLNFILNNNNLSQEQKTLALEKFIEEGSKTIEYTDLPPEYYYPASTDMFPEDEIFGKIISSKQTKKRIPRTSRLVITKDIDLIPKKNSEIDFYQILEDGKGNRFYVTNDGCKVRLRGEPKN